MQIAKKEGDILDEDSTQFQKNVDDNRNESLKRIPFDQKKDPKLLSKQSHKHQSRNNYTNFVNKIKKMMDLNKYEDMNQKK